MHTYPTPTPQWKQQQAQVQSTTKNACAIHAAYGVNLSCLSPPYHAADPLDLCQACADRLPSGLRRTPRGTCPCSQPWHLHNGQSICWIHSNACLGMDTACWKLPACHRHHFLHPRHFRMTQLQRTCPGRYSQPHANVCTHLSAMMKDARHHDPWVCCVPSAGASYPSHPAAWTTCWAAALQSLHYLPAHHLHYHTTYAHQQWHYNSSSSSSTWQRACWQQLDTSLQGVVCVGPASQSTFGSGVAR